MRGSASSSSPLRISLLWHSLRSDNLGVGALTIANTRIARKATAAAGSVTFDIVGFGGGGRTVLPSYREGFSETLVGSSKNLLPGFPVWKALGRRHRPGYRRRRQLRRYLRREALHVDVGAETHGPAAGQAGGPGTANDRPVQAPYLHTARQLRHEALPQGFRARWPVEGCARSGEARDIAAESIDVAFRLPFERQTRTPDGRIRFGLNVSGLLYAGGYTGKNQFGIKGDYRAMIDQIVAGLLARGDTEVVLVPHVITPHGDSEDDIYVS